jgi:hypothetical protein
MASENKEKHFANSDPLSVYLAEVERAPLSAAEAAACWEHIRAGINRSKPPPRT